jgi:hypothetical protein
MSAPIKLTTPDGFTFEIDSIDQAVALKQRLGSSSASAPRQPRAQSNAAPQPKRGGDVLTMSTVEFLDVLWKAANGLTTDEAAAALNVNPKSIPPLVRSLHNWCSRRSLKLDDLLTRRPRYIDRKQVTQYKLTEQGRHEFMSIVTSHVSDVQHKEEESKATA